MSDNEKQNDISSNKKLKSIFGKNIGYWSVGLVVIAFLIVGVISPTRKTNDLWSIICDSALLFFLGITITSSLIYQASLDGDKSDKVIKARSQVNISYSGIKDNTQDIDVYTWHKNKTAQKEVITNYLKSVNLDYSEHFNSDGTFKYDSFLKINEFDREFVKKDKEAKNMILEKLAEGVNISTISRADVLCQDEVSNNDPLKRAKTEKQFIAQENGKMMVSKVFSAILGSCWGATFIGISWGEMLYKLLWAIMLIAMAMLSYIKTYRYKTVDYVSRLNQSARWMDEYSNMINTEEFKQIKNEYNRMYYSTDNIQNNTKPTQTNIDINNTTENNITSTNTRQNNIEN